MPSYTYFNPISNIDAKRIAQGRLWNVMLVPNGLKPTTGSKLPRLRLIPSTTATANVRTIFPTSFSGGASTVAAVAYIKTVLVADNSLSDGVDTLTVGTKTYTFVSGAPVGDQIQIGGSASATATNIATKLTADAGTIGIASAVAATATVTITGLATGVDFSFSCLTPYKLNLAVTQVGNIAVVAAAGSLVLRLDGRYFVPSTQVYLAFTQFEYPSGSGTRNYRMEWTTEVISESDTQQAIFTRLMNAIIASATNTPFLNTYTRLVHDIPEATSALIATALQDVLSATPASKISITGTGSSARMTITAGSNGTWANYFEIELGVRNSVPSPLINFGPNGPNYVGAFGPGLMKEFSANPTTTTAENNYDNLFYRASQPVTGGAVQCQMTIGQNLDHKLLARVGGATQFTRNSIADLVLPGGTSDIPEFGIVLYSEDQGSGIFDGTLLYAVQNVSGLTLSKSRTAAPDIQLTFTAVPFETLSPGAPFGYEFRINSLA